MIYSCQIFRIVFTKLRNTFTRKRIIRTTKSTPIQFTPLNFFIQLGAFFLTGQAKDMKKKNPTSFHSVVISRTPITWIRLIYPVKF